jgi:hypothetical protein
MFYSEKHKILIIGIPKNGSRAIQKAMFEFEPKGENNSITIKNRIYKPNEFRQRLLGHARAREIKEVIGSTNFNKINSIAFIRHPLAKLVSAYNFNKKINLFDPFSGKKNAAFKIRFRQFITALLPRLLPFQIWCLFYPYRSNLEYVNDFNGKSIVKYIGRTEYLEADFKQIMDSIGIDSNRVNIQKVNVGKYKEWKKYYKGNWITNLIKEKVKEDLKFYYEICKEWEDT